MNRFKFLTRLTRSSLSITALLLALGLTVATSVERQPVGQAFNPQAAQASGTVRKPATVPFELVNNHIVLKVRINQSRPLSFVLDTGDQFAIVNIDTARALGLKLHGQVRVGGAGAQIATGSFVDDATFTIPALEGFSQPVSMALPIGHLASRFGQDFDGIIGADFIQQSVLELDYQSRVLRMHDKKTFSYSGPGISIPIQLVHGHPTLEAEVSPLGVETTKGRFVLDIGSGLALALYSPFVKEHQILNSGLKTITSLGGAGAGGETTGRFGRVVQLKIGPYILKNLITLFSEDKAGAFASPALAGNIGARIAKRFRLFLDYDRGRIIFEPNTSFQHDFDYAFSGLSIVAQGDDYRTFVVRAVLNDSPATEAGLQKGDVIVSVNGKSASELTLSALNEMLEQPVPYQLTIRRGTQQLQVTLVPKRLV